MPSWGVMFRAATIGALAAMSSNADTVTMKDGVQVHGSIVEQDASKIVVQIGNRRVPLRADEVLTIEKNARTGLADDPETRRVFQEREVMQQELTGLNEDQRSEVNRLLKTLATGEDSARLEAKRQLVALAETIDLFKYLHFQLSSAPRSFMVPAILELYVEIRPAEAKDMLLQYCTHPDPFSRAKALSLLGKVSAEDSGDTIIRGMADEFPEVRISAADTLGVHGIKKATPLLIANLAGNNRSLFNACLTALSSMWSTPEAPVEFKTLPEWQAFWQQNSTAVDAPYRTEDVTPLVPFGTQVYDH